MLIVDDDDDDRLACAVCTVHPAHRTLLPVLLTGARGRILDTSAGSAAAVLPCVSHVVDSVEPCSHCQASKRAPLPLHASERDWTGDSAAVFGSAAARKGDESHRLNCAAHTVPTHTAVGQDTGLSPVQREHRLSYTSQIAHTGLLLLGFKGVRVNATGQFR